jgi:hypothetical protein
MGTEDHFSDAVNFDCIKTVPGLDKNSLHSMTSSLQVSFRKQAEVFILHD